MAWDCSGDDTLYVVPKTWSHIALHPTAETCSCTVTGLQSFSPYSAVCNITIGTTTYNGVIIAPGAYVEYSPHLYTWRIHADTASFSWDDYASINLCAEYTVTDYYVKASGGSDSNDGLSWATAWASIHHAANTVADGTTVHIGFGNYSQTNAQDIAPINAGPIGIKYLPETETTGGGTGEVKITLTT